MNSIEFKDILWNPFNNAFVGVNIHRTKHQKIQLNFPVFVVKGNSGEPN